MSTQKHALSEDIEMGLEVAFECMEGGREQIGGFSI